MKIGGFIEVNLKAMNQHSQTNTFEWTVNVTNSMTFMAVYQVTTWLNLRVRIIGVIWLGTRGTCPSPPPLPPTHTHFGMEINNVIQFAFYSHYFWTHSTHILTVAIFSLYPYSHSTHILTLPIFSFSTHILTLPIFSLYPYSHSLPIFSLYLYSHSIHILTHILTLPIFSYPEHVQYT